MLKKIILLIAIIIATTSMNKGSCLKYSPDGEDCLECANNHHLFNNKCSMDILGCQRYEQGNICH